MFNNFLRRRDAYNQSILFPVTTIKEEPIPCDGYSPWINEHKPWLEDGDTEFKTLLQLREQFNFCAEVRSKPKTELENKYLS